MIKIKNQKLKYIIETFLRLLNRFAPYLEIALIFYFINIVVNNNQDNGWFNLLYVIPILLLYRLLKWEYKAIATKEIIKDTCVNARVQGFCGFQGRGKTSYMLYCGYVLNSKNVFSNFPCKIRNKFAYMLDDKILNMDEKVPEKSILLLSEATLFYHNLLHNTKDVEIATKLYGQELHQQIVRHAYNGNIFYDSIDLNRMPQMLRENIGLTNYMLGQKSKTFSFILTPLIISIAKIFDIEIIGNMRVWELQQFEKIPDKQYTFDLSTQEKDTNTKNYANLLEVCAWCDIRHFDYDDRFLKGLYDRLPDAIKKAWDTLQFSDNDLRQIGYGFIIDFFEKKLHKKEITLNNFLF